MSKELKYSVGIDVSKNDYHCCFSVINDQQRIKIKASRKFKSNELAKLNQWIDEKKKSSIPLVVTMEATGVYYENLAWYLFKQDRSVSVLLPNKAKKYLEALGLKSKNDSIDAEGLSKMGAQQNLPLWKPISKELYNLRNLTRHHTNLQEMKTVLQNRLHALKYQREINDEVENQILVQIDLLNDQIKEIIASIEATINKDPVMKEKVENIIRIKGVSTLTVASIIAETDGFELFENQAQLVSYAGYDVVENQSGKHVGKTKISKKGNSRIRRALHMPSLNAVRFEGKPFKCLFQRVYSRTNIKLKGYVAVQRKLLVTIYALWTKNEPYNPLHEEIKSSGNHETKLLFRQSILASRKGWVWKEAGRLVKSLPALDELPSNQST